MRGDHPKSSPAVSGRFLTISNALSLLRLLLSIPFVLVMTSDVPGARLWGGAIIALAALTDKLDGVFARKFHQASEWGKVLDPLADKVAVTVVAVTLLQAGDIPLWFLVLLVSRDVLIMLGGIAVKAKTGILMPSNIAGKWTVGVIALTLFLLVLGVKNAFTNILIMVSACMAVISFAWYLIAATRIIQKA
jgi:CDP-diacylglycerol--glycerol-3-phosphate 3-phosphatidyltransferase